MTARDDAEVVEAVAGVLCASRDLTDARHEAQDVPCGPCYRDAAALLPLIREREARAWDGGRTAGYEDRRSEGQFIRFVESNPYRTDEAAT